MDSFIDACAAASVRTDAEWGRIGFPRRISDASLSRDFSVVHIRDIQDGGHRGSKHCIMVSRVQQNTKRRDQRIEKVVFIKVLFDGVRGDSRVYDCAVSIIVTRSCPL